MEANTAVCMIPRLSLACMTPRLLVFQLKRLNDRIEHEERAQQEAEANRMLTEAQTNIKQQRVEIIRAEAEIQVSEWRLRRLRCYYVLLCEYAARSCSGARTDGSVRCSRARRAVRHNETYTTFTT